MRGGFSAYIRALSLLPCTGQMMADLTGISKQSAGRYLRELSRVGLARPSGHEPTGKRGGSRLIFDHGNGVRCGRPSAICNTLALVVNAIREGATTAEAVERLGINRTSVTDIVRGLRRAGLVHISEWRRDDRTPVPVYVYARGEDAPFPKKTPRKVTNARYWAARKAKLQQLQVIRALAGSANDDEAQAA